MERETKKITTTKGHEVEIYTYITGGETRTLKNLLVGKAKYEGSEDNKSLKLTGFDGGALVDIERETLKTMIVSVDGNKDNPSNIVDRFPADEYEEVLKAINEVTKDAISGKTEKSDFLAS